MKRRDAERIIREERLISHSFFERRQDASDEMVIRKAAEKWSVYATDERAAKISGGERIFEREEDALDNFIRRLRALNRIRNLV